MSYVEEAWGRGRPRRRKDGEETSLVPEHLGEQEVCTG